MGSMSSGRIRTISFPVRRPTHPVVPYERKTTATAGNEADIFVPNNSSGLYRKILPSAMPSCASAIGKIYPAAGSTLSGSVGTDLFRCSRRHTQPSAHSAGSESPDATNAETAVFTRETVQVTATNSSSGLYGNDAVRNSTTRVTKSNKLSENL